jgi:very-short-patch-repair endonuclease
MCNKIFNVIPAENRIKYCSQKCYHIYKTAPYIIKSCLVCKKLFQVKSYNKKAKYCSNSCSNHVSGKIAGPIVDKLNKLNKKGIYNMSHNDFVRTGAMSTGGIICRDNKLGVCNLSIEDRRKYGIIGGYKAAQINRQNKTGICHDKKLREKYPTPYIDTKIEIKIQDYLKQLGIEFHKHKYLNIKHNYPCDIFIPSKNLVIECDGDYWHGNILKYPILQQWQLNQIEEDKIRTKELIDKGYNVIRLWENEIKRMNLQELKYLISKF